MESSWLDAARDMGLDVMLGVILAMLALDAGGRLVQRWRGRALETTAPLGTALPERPASGLDDNAAQAAPTPGTPHDRPASAAARRVA
jgi:hypothetical protein